MKKFCERCKENDAVTMSIFNTDMICLECEERERNHPKYEEAKKEENEAVKNGNYNFDGIGKPKDL